MAFITNSPGIMVVKVCVARPFERKRRISSLCHVAFGCIFRLYKGLRDSRRPTGTQRITCRGISFVRNLINWGRRREEDFDTGS